MTKPRNQLENQNISKLGNISVNLDPDYQNPDPCDHELLSALADGQLGADGEALGRILRHACETGADAMALRKNWAIFHLIGEVLRAPDTVCMSQRSLLEKIQNQIQREIQETVKT